jgi:type IV secretion system protein VirB9
MDNVLKTICMLALLATSTISSAYTRPLTTDSRIRTMVYSENEVFRLITRFGYESSIEFTPSEKIKVVSVGDSTPFRVNPEGNRIFVKANLNNQITNMTVVTTKHAYHFELSSLDDEKNEVIYVMRFYYPEDGFNDTRTKENGGEALKKPNGVYQYPGRSISEPSGNFKEPSSNFNYGYSMSGNSAYKPNKVFDNGKFTYFQFDGVPPPMIKEVMPDGSEVIVQSQPIGKYVVVNKIMAKAALYFGQEVICLFNDKLIPSGAPRMQ